jgi:transposase
VGAGNSGGVSVEREQFEAVALAGGEPARALVVGLLERIAAVERDIVRLSGKIGGLEQIARRDSGNSSVAPSADPPRSRQQRRAEARAKAKEQSAREGAAARNPGKQRGAAGSGRKLLPEDQIDEFAEYFPVACGGCAREFREDERVPGAWFGRHQVVELPPITVLVTEHRTHRLRCPDCHAQTAGTLPDEVACSAFGPGLQAAVVTLTARNRVSRRDMSELVRDLFGIGLSIGSVEAICQRASRALQLPHEALGAHVLAQPAINADETGWRTAGEQRTLWTATTERAAIFKVAEDRHRDRLTALIGEYDGIVCSDRWWAYDHLDPECRQACWAHLRRDFKFHAEGLAEQKQFGEQGLALTKRMFKTWHTPENHQDRARLAAEMKPIQTELHALLEHAGRKSKRTRLHRRFANNLLKIWPALWTFITTDGVEPTNNAAERSLRGPVISRRLSQGTRTQHGERFVERALSASVTCRLQHRSLFAYMHELLTAHSRGDPLPTLT